MRKQPVTRRQFLESGIAAAGAISISGALPANARDWEEYSARFDRSISDGLPAGPLRPGDETYLERQSFFIALSRSTRSLPLGVRYRLSPAPRAQIKINDLIQGWRAENGAHPWLLSFTLRREDPPSLHRHVCAGIAPIGLAG